VVPLICALVTLAACGTGARPSLGVEVPVVGGTGSAVGDVATDAVLQRLEQVAGHTFTASYRLRRKFGDKATTATVVQNGVQISVTVGDVRFLMGSRTVTCSLASGQCQDGTLDARISDFSVASNFFAVSPARALRVAYARKSGDTIGVEQTIAGIRSTCVEVPLGGGSERYCATPVGAVAQWDTAAIHIELSGLTDSVDPTAFDVPA
jgi:hypothetical protein